MRRIWALGLLTIAAAFIVAACGGDDGDTPTAVPTQAATAPGGTTPPPTERLSPTAEPQSTAAPLPQVTTARYSWEISTVDDTGAKPSLAVDSAGTPHIAYLLESMPGFVKHAVSESAGWNISEVATGYFYGPLDIAVDDLGRPHVAWHNHDFEDGAYATLVDGEWLPNDIIHPGHDGWDINVALDSKNQPRIVSIDPKQFGSTSGVEYAEFDGESWQVEDVGSGPQPYEFGTSIAVDSQDRSHVAWFDEPDQDLKYAVKNGSGWDISTVDSEGDVGRFPFLTLDSQDNPIISYFEKVTDTSGYFKLARWDGSDWDSQRIDKLNNVFLGFFGARKTSSVALDKDDHPIVAYSDEDVIKLAWWDGAQWNLETVLTADESTLGQQVSLGIDQAGTLHLTYADMTVKAPPGVEGAVKYAKGTPK